MSAPNVGPRRVSLEGELSIYRAAELKPHLLEQLERADSLELDLANVAELDTAGVQLLVMVKREGARTNKPVRLVGHSDAVIEVFELANLGPELSEPIPEVSRGDAP